MRDRHKHLRIPIEGILEAELDGVALSLRCTELSVGGARVVAVPELGAASRLDLKALTLGEVRYDLAFMGELEAGPDGATDVWFVDMDAVGKSNVQIAFAAAVAPVLSERKNAGVSMRFAWAFRDAAQLAKVCKALLAHVDMVDAWTAAGPSDHARVYLARGGGDLPPSQLAMLRTVWTLWCGSLDVGAYTGELPESAQASLQALQKAMQRGPAGVDAWLSVEG